MPSRRTNFRIDDGLYQRLQQYAIEHGVSINTLITYGVKNIIGDTMYTYRIERLHVPAHHGASPTNEGREFSRRIIHVFGEAPSTIPPGTGRVLEVLTEENSATSAA